MKEVVFDRPITADFIYFLDKKGDLEYFPAFARPFFKVKVAGHYFLKGIENSLTAHLTLYKRKPEESLKIFFQDIEDYCRTA